jgi:hypothetical protein
MARRRWLARSVLIAVLGAWGLLLGAGPRPAAAQGGVGPLQLEAGLFGVAGTGERLPFWLAANRYGTVDPTSANAGLQLSARRPFAEPSGLDYAFGAEVLGRLSARETAYVHQLYGRLRYGGLQLTAGRREQMVGRVDTSLSLGSVTWSRNATPPPKISLSSDGYVPVPGLGDALAVKGYLAQGWLEEDRFVRNTLLHEKYLYVRIRPPGVPVNVHAGVVHHAQWGGTHPRKGPQASSLGEWADVAFLTDVLFTEDRTEAESQRSQANHIAAYDFSLGVDLGGWKGLAYRQFYHEDVASLWFRNVWDGLWGAGLRRTDGPALVEALLWEHFRLTRQNARFSAGEVRGSDKAYSHSVVYRGGWTYQGRTLGIPLVTPSSATPGLQDNLPGIGNSIVVAHHLAIEGHLGAGLSYQAMGTYSRNYGAQSICTDVQCTGFEGPDGITPRRDQWSFRVRVGGPLSEQYNLRFRAAAAFDTGEFYDDRVGLRLGLQWRGLYAPGRASGAQ